MILPPLLSIKDFISAENNKEFDKIALIEKAKQILYRDFVEIGVYYNGQKVFIREKLLDCSLTNNKCSNDFCTCENCPWKNYTDMFQHLTSDYDSNLEKFLTKKAHKIVSKRKNSNPNYKVRTPGIFSKARTIRISWIKAIIENFDDEDIQQVVIPKRNNEFIVKLYHKKEDYLVILTGVTYTDGNTEFFLTSAYHNPFPTLLRDFHS